MGVYASLDDVQRRMPQFTLGPETRPNRETAQTLLDDTHAQFEAAMMSLGYQIPITGRLSIAQSKEIVCNGTICKILNARGAAVGTDAAFQSADRACEAYATALQLLADPESPVKLSDAVGVVGGDTPMGLYPLPPRITMDSKF